MTDPTTPAEQTEQAEQEQHPEQTEEAEHDDHEADPTKLRAEAAKYRRRAQDAEAERDTLRAEIDGLRRSEIEHRVADRLETPEDLWLVHDTETFMGDDGIDDEAIRAAVDALLEQRPQWRKRRPADDLPRRPQLNDGTALSSGSWSGVLRRS